MPNLDALFWPRSIALVGASPDKSGIRGRIVDAVRQHGFDGPLYPVSRSHKRIDGLTAYPCVSALPESVDLAIVTIPAVYVPDALVACSRAAPSSPRSSAKPELMIIAARTPCRPQASRESGT